MASRRPEIEPTHLLAELEHADAAGSGEKKSAANASYALLELRCAADRQETRRAVGSAGSQVGSAVGLAVGLAGARVTFRERMDGEALRRAWTAQVRLEAHLRVVFVDSKSWQGESVTVDRDTRHFLQEHLHISPIFFHRIAFEEFGVKSQIGNASFSDRDRDGTVSSLYGFYQFRSGGASRQSHLWFFHDVAARSSTYVVVLCPDRTKERILSVAFSDQPARLVQPLAVDAIVADDFARSWLDDIQKARDHLIAYEHLRTTGAPNVDTAKAVEQLHDLSQQWHLFVGDLEDFEDRLRFLLDMSSKLRVVPAQGDPTDGHSIAQSIEYLVARNRVWKRWVQNYNERTKIRINLFFNLASQSDSRTNLEIAKLTSEIAVDTQKDSSSMITIAGLTMFFLPGTFMSAVFSMVFFNVGTDSEGKPSFTVSPRWWYFLATTVPLTVVVFAVWLLWQRRRYQSKKKYVASDVLPLEV